jgi:hypothetical protein
MLQRKTSACDQYPMLKQQGSTGLIRPLWPGYSCRAGNLAALAAEMLLGTWRPVAGALARKEKPPQR